MSAFLWNKLSPAQTTSDVNFSASMTKFTTQRCYRLGK